MLRTCVDAGRPGPGAGFRPAASAPRCMSWTPIAAVFGLGPRAGALPGSGWDATATLKERDTGERGQPVRQLVLESRVTGLWCGHLSLPVGAVAAAHRRGRVVADGQPCLRDIAHLQT